MTNGQTLRRRRIETAGAAVGVLALVWLTLLPDGNWVPVLGIALGVAAVYASAPPGSRRLAAAGPIALLLGMSLVSLAVTPLPSLTYGETWLLWGSIGAFYLVSIWASTRERVLRLGVMLMTLGCAFALAAPFAVAWFTYRKTFFPPALYDLFPRIAADAIHPNVMASILLALVFVPVSWAVHPPRLTARWRSLQSLLGRRWPWIATAALMIAVLLLTKSRGGYIAFAAGALALLFLLGGTRGRLRWAALAALVVAGGMALGWLMSNGGLGPGTPTEALDTESLTFRWRVWKYASLVISDFPYTGTGMGAFNEVAASLYGYYSQRQPGAHNLFLQVALDLGIPGAIAFAALVIAALARGLRAQRALEHDGDAALSFLAAGGLAGLAAVLVQGLIDIAAWGTKGGFVLWLVLALLWSLTRYPRLRRAETNTAARSPD